MVRLFGLELCDDFLVAFNLGIPFVWLGAIDELFGFFLSFGFLFLFIFLHKRLNLLC